MFVLYSETHSSYFFYSSLEDTTPGPPYFLLRVSIRHQSRFVNVTSPLMNKHDQENQDGRDLLSDLSHIQVGFHCDQDCGASEPVEMASFIIPFYFYTLRDYSSCNTVREVKHTTECTLSGSSEHPSSRRAAVFTQF